MRSTICALLITLAVAAIIIAGIRHGQNLDAMHQHIATLENQMAARQAMLDDMHRLIPHLERKVACINYEYSTRELLWILADELEQAGVSVEVH
jgi:hypothetical protein